MKKDIELALGEFRRRAPLYEKAKRYYKGRHNLAFASEKFANTFGSLFREFALNLCPAVCDSTADRLKITGFAIERQPDFSRNTDGDKSDADLRRIEKAIGRIRSENNFEILTDEIHSEALTAGDAYLIIWPDAEGRPAFYPQRAENCIAIYDEDGRREMKFAAKIWPAGGSRLRLNLYYHDRTERYISTDAEPGRAAKDAAGFKPFIDGDGIYRVENPYGMIPVFHFANNPGIGNFGSSELEAVMPIQDGMNKAVLDMLVAMEVSAYRQRWAAGIEIQFDKEGNPRPPFKAGIDHLWLAENPDAKFGDFAAADLEQFLKVKDGFRIDIASVSATPLYYLMPQAGAYPSGESLRKAETRFLAKVKNRQATFGVRWARAMEFALRICGFAGVRLTTRWEDAANESERERLETLEIKRRIGLSAKQALREAGYGEEQTGESAE